MVRLRRSDSSGRGLRRLKAGRGFTYRDVDGTTLTDPELRARIEHLGIPPAWREVWIAPYVNGHIQATGIDAAGRRQYIYHPTWREQKDRIKFDRALSLAESLPVARRKVTLDLRREQPDRDRASAAAFRMLDQGSLRVGSERYAEQHGSYGLSTLLCAHVRVSGDTVHLAFPAKSGQSWESDIRDEELARVVAGLKRRGPNAHLLAFRDGRGHWHPLGAFDINSYVREQTGGEFTAKDFRTLHGTLAAAVSLAKAGPQPSEYRRRKALAQSMRDAAAVLSNTPAIAKSSYVDPRLVDKFNEGLTIDPARLASAESELRALLYE
ncbi:DNA topoisomerase IB [Subtercola boreus]|uniref:DNA topoisomerase n=1 Tax=Subtercola boreus TaxID=120213 RepID=A0A3E0WB53_9MICO|nr:DNA topoisomerase IB [Subtercola boreus]RFA19457.1 DNA topoisomerase [Subtercola boreus]RFA19718.1 DNA topoisomerase [Subtercola boreus]RFA26084.1 DNA topoisomerase [Subtercola boreus]